MKHPQIAKRVLSQKQQEALFKTLKTRFEKHVGRHKTLVWAKVQAKLEAQPAKVWSLFQMEETGGEPDVTGYDKKTDSYQFVDCSAESPIRRRSTCYDREGWESRKEHRPEQNAQDMGQAMGIEMLTEEQYRGLQALMEVDLKTSSWIQTPVAMRALGGALFADRRYEQVFVYHNGASSYYAARGFRGVLSV